MREIILDTETTGLEPKSGHRIIEIGAVEVVNKIITGKKFHCYINPKRDVPKEAYNIHGISTEFLRNKPLFEAIVDEFLAFVMDSPMVIHNAPFDIKFLNHELALLDRSSFNLNKTVDTLKIARAKFPGQKVNLDALCKRYKIDSSFRVFHGALKDAELLAKVYLNLVEHSDQKRLLADLDGGVLKSQGNTYTDFNFTKIRAITPTPQEIILHNNFMYKIKHNKKS